MNSPATRRALSEMWVFADVRAALSSVQSPSLVLYRSGDRFAGKPHATYLAEHIAGALLVEIAGDDNLIFAGDSDADVDEIEEFLTEPGTRPKRTASWPRSCSPTSSGRPSGPHRSETGPGGNSWTRTTASCADSSTGSAAAR